mmetsp:Transcript_28774/g.85660  ORF Transcript_28774/g.85660 Transcript_28774/m.85660 type:complete len:226 (+) Transcript_28774:145-822(+)
MFSSNHCMVGTSTIFAATFRLMRSRSLVRTHDMRWRSCVSLLYLVSGMWCRSFQLSRMPGVMAGRELDFFMPVMIRGFEDRHRCPEPATRWGEPGSSGGSVRVPEGFRMGVGSSSGSSSSSTHVHCSSRNLTSSHDTLPAPFASNCSKSRAQVGLGIRTFLHKAKNSTRAKWSLWEKTFSRPPRCSHPLRRPTSSMKTCGSKCRRETKPPSCTPRELQRFAALPA